MLEVKSMWSGGLMLKSDESLDWTFGARAEPEQRCVRAGADMCQSQSGLGSNMPELEQRYVGVLRSPESRHKKVY